MTDLIPDPELEQLINEVNVTLNSQTPADTFLPEEVGTPLSTMDLKGTVFFSPGGYSENNAKNGTYVARYISAIRSNLRRSLDFAQSTYGEYASFPQSAKTPNLTTSFSPRHENR